jgi:hypothetical protein
LPSISPRLGRKVTLHTRSGSTQHITQISAQAQADRTAVASIGKRLGGMQLRLAHPDSIPEFLM